MSLNLRLYADRPVIIGGWTGRIAHGAAPCVRARRAHFEGPVGARILKLACTGRVAASLGQDDRAALHAADTIAAADGLCDDEGVRYVTEKAPEAIEALIRFGARFDQDTGGRLRLGLEAAHSRRRIVHAVGDATRGELMRALILAVRPDSVRYNYRGHGGTPTRR